MPDLHCIVYVSTATRLMDHDELEGLLIEARQLNLDTFTTGVLLYNDGNFMQYFEGSPESVRLTYDRILASRRHTGIIELLNEPISERRFPDWQMAMARPTASELLTLSTAVWKLAYNEGAGATSETPGVGLLRTFWRHARPG